MRHGTCRSGGGERNSEGDRVSMTVISFSNETFEDRWISRWKRSRSYKVSAVCEVVAAREAAGV
jgi:hypothetical protein